MKSTTRMYFAGKADITGPVADINLMVCMFILFMNVVYLLGYVNKYLT